MHFPPLYDETRLQIKLGKRPRPCPPLHCGCSELRRALPLPYKKLPPRRKGRKAQADHAVRRNKPQSVGG